MKTMMYRRYITTGMNKQKRGLLFFSGVVLIICSRILFFFFAGLEVEDTYGYFEQAMIRTGKTEFVFSSGLSYAFTHALSVVLRFVGNRHFMAGLWQMLLQILWMSLFLEGTGKLLGRAAGFVSSLTLMLSPWIFKSVFVITPENYFMLYAAFVLVLLGHYAKAAKEKGWRENFPGRLYLAAVGGLLGLLCIWSYLGWVLFFICIYLQVKNYRHWKGKTIDRERMMGAAAQGVRVLFWFLAGILACLMRYTAFTGLPILGQLDWWRSYLTDIHSQGQEISGLLTLWLITAFGAGVICRRVSEKHEKPEEEEMIMEETAVEERKGLQETAEKDGNAEKEQAKVKLLDNPLPVPKKHVKKEIAFDIEDVKMEFDISVSEDDDFDIS